MTISTLNLTEQRNPTAQTFIVDTESVITGIGVFFATADTTLPIILELRPTTEDGSPSSKNFIPGTRVVGTAAAVAAVASTTFGSAAEYKFEFPEPVYVPGNSLLAICIYTSAPVGSYKMFYGKNGEFEIGTTTKRYISNLNTADGALYSSSNGTTWVGDNTKDMSFKVYKARFTTGVQHTAALQANVPPLKALTESTVIDNPAAYPYDPLIFTSGDATVGVIHPSHGFQSGDVVKLFGLDSSTEYNGVLGSNIIGSRTITAVDPYGYTFEMGSVADSSIRGGGVNLLATEQYSVDQLLVNFNYITPPNTNIALYGNLTTSKSFAGSETAYNITTDIPLPIGNVSRFTNPYVIASAETETARLSGQPSAVFDVILYTNDENVAPYFDVTSGLVTTAGNFVDYQDSIGGSLRNTIVTIPFVDETQPNGGTTASKHLSIPYILQNAATSIVVLVDAVRPAGSDFSVWYRKTNRADEGPLLQDESWTEFSKTAKLTTAGGNTYTELGTNDNYDQFREYEFSVFDLNAFDEYQLKITFNTTRQTYPPVFRNLRSIATVA